MVFWSLAISKNDFFPLFMRYYAKIAFLFDGWHEKFTSTDN